MCLVTLWLVCVMMRMVLSCFLFPFCAFFCFFHCFCHCLLYAVPVFLIFPFSCFLPLPWRVCLCFSFIFIFLLFLFPLFCFVSSCTSLCDPIFVVFASFPLFSRTLSSISFFFFGSFFLPLQLFSLFSY